MTAEQKYEIAPYINAADSHILLTGTGRSFSSTGSTKTQLHCGEWEGGREIPPVVLLDAFDLVFLDQ